jgi:hypothetical protein
VTSLRHSLSISTIIAACDQAPLMCVQCHGCHCMIAMCPRKSASRRSCAPACFDLALSWCSFLTMHQGSGRGWQAAQSAHARAQHAKMGGSQKQITKAAPESEAPCLATPDTNSAFLVTTDRILKDVIVQYLNNWACMPMNARTR